MDQTLHSGSKTTNITMKAIIIMKAMLSLDINCSRGMVLKGQSSIEISVLSWDFSAYVNFTNMNIIICFSSLISVALLSSSSSSSSPSPSFSLISLSPQSMNNFSFWKLLFTLVVLQSLRGRRQQQLSESTHPILVQPKGRVLQNKGSVLCAFVVGYF